MIEIEKAAVAIENEIIYAKDPSGSTYKKYWLHLKLEVPGGELKYKIEVREDVYKSIDFAHTVIKQSKK